MSGNTKNLARLVKFLSITAVVTAAVVLQFQVASAATYTVTKTADTSDGTCDADCSLREAIIEANANAGLDTIDFDGALEGETIDLDNADPSDNALPIFTEEAILDGTTLSSHITLIADAQAGAVIQFINSDSGNVMKGVNLSGGYYGVYALGTTGLTLGGSAAGDGNTIDGYTNSGFFLDSDDDSFILGNTLGGTDGGDVGINATNCTNLTLGGTAAGAKNIVVGNSYGIAVGTVDTLSILGNWIGTEDGTTANANGWGIYLAGTLTDVTIGGTAAGSRNVISGNTAGGVNVTTATATNVLIQGNYIGTNAAGDDALANGSGIITDSAITIGGTAVGAGNVISGNTERNILLEGAGDTAEVANLTGSTVQGNLIGLNAAGTAAIVGGAGHGIQIYNSHNTIGGTTASARNIISGNSWDGILLQGAFSLVQNNIIEGNYIGTNAAGDAAIANGNNGVEVISGASLNFIGVASYGNLISGNTQRGVYIDNSSDSNTVAGNIIGLNAAGTDAVANGFSGIQVNSSNSTLIGGTSSASRNVISGNSAQGVVLSGTSTGNILEKNYIGTDSTGSAAVGNSSYGIYIVDFAASNFIGVAGYGNMVSGNGARGILILGDDADNNSFQGNVVGLSADGTTALGNADGGIVIVNADGTVIGTANTPTARNIVSSNTEGIWIWGGADNTIVVNNYIGLASDGITVRANTSNGIRIENGTASSIIGGTATGAGNTAAASTGNSCYAVMGDSGDFNAFRHNSCVNESATVMNITRGGTANENLASPVVTAETSTTSEVFGTAFANAAVDIFVDGVYSASATADGDGAWSKTLSVGSGGLVSASATNGTLSSSATTTPQVAVADDVSNPTASSLSPEDNATGVSTTSNLVLTFNEVVVIGTGDIVIKKSSDNSTVETIDVTDGAKVTGTETTALTINPATTLGALVEYYVQVPATAVDDLSGNSYAGILDTTSWSFTTLGTAGITVSEVSGDTSEDGDTATFTIQLDTEPSADVVIAVSSSNTAEGTVSPASLTFTNEDWATPKTVTVTGVADDVNDGDSVFTVVLGAATSADSNYNALNPADVSVTNNDVPSTPTGGGGSPVSHHSDSGPTSSGSSDSDTSSAMDFVVPTHWAAQYLTKLLENDYVMNVARHEASLLSLLEEMFTSPDQGVNRGEALQFLLIYNEMDLGNESSDGLAFSDVPADYLRAAYIDFASHAGLVNGYSDGSFGPELTVNRAEVLKMVSMFFGDSVDTSLKGSALLAEYGLSENPFSDLDLNEWFAPYVLYMYSNGVVEGYGDGTFGAGNPVTFAELLKIVTLHQEL